MGQFCLFKLFSCVEAPSLVGNVLILEQIFTFFCSLNLGLSHGQAASSYDGLVFEFSACKDEKRKAVGWERMDRG